MLILDDDPTDMDIFATSSTHRWPEIGCQTASFKREKIARLHEMSLDCPIC